MGAPVPPPAAAAAPASAPPAATSSTLSDAALKNILWVLGQILDTRDKGSWLITPTVNKKPFSEGIIPLHLDFQSTEEAALFFAQLQRTYEMARATINADASAVASPAPAVRLNGTGPTSRPAPETIIIPQCHQGDIVVEQFWQPDIETEPLLLNGQVLAQYQRPKTKLMLRLLFRPAKKREEASQGTILDRCDEGDVIVRRCWPISQPTPSIPPQWKHTITTYSEDGMNVCYMRCALPAAKTPPRTPRRLPSPRGASASAAADPISRPQPCQPGHIVCTLQDGTVIREQRWVPFENPPPLPASYIETSVGPYQESNQWVVRQIRCEAPSKRDWEAREGL